MPIGNKNGSIRLPVKQFFAPLETEFFVDSIWVYGPKQRHHSYHSNANWPYTNQINCFNHNANEINEKSFYFFFFIFLMNIKCYSLFIYMMTVKCGPRNAYRCMANVFICFNKKTAVFRSINIIVSTFVGVFLFRMFFFW